MGDDFRNLAKGAKDLIEQRNAAHWKKIATVRKQLESAREALWEYVLPIFEEALKACEDEGIPCYIDKSDYDDLDIIDLDDPDIIDLEVPDLDISQSLSIDLYFGGGDDWGFGRGDKWGKLNTYLRNYTSVMVYCDGKTVFVDLYSDQWDEIEEELDDGLHDIDLEAKVAAAQPLIKRAISKALQYYAKHIA